MNEALTGISRTESLRTRLSVDIMRLPLSDELTTPPTSTRSSTGIQPERILEACQRGAGDAGAAKPVLDTEQHRPVENPTMLLV